MKLVSQDDLIDRMARLKEAGAPFVCVTVIGTRGSCPRKTGAKMLVTADGRTFGTIGGGPVEVRVSREAKDVLADPEVRRLELDLGESEEGPMYCGGRMEFLFEPFVAGPQVLIFGAGHVGAALHRLLSTLHFGVTLVDDREELLTMERLPGARLVNSDPAAAARDLDISSGAFCVVVNPTHEKDQETILALAGRDLGYLGLMASSRKRKKVFSALKEHGVSEADLEEIHCPVGLNIGSETPEEIAVSIAAEMVAAMRGKL